MSDVTVQGIKQALSSNGIGLEKLKEIVEKTRSEYAKVSELQAAM
jgi:hypothetical protein